MKDQAVKIARDIGDAPVEVAKNISHLGVYIDSSLNWKKHIQESSKKYRGLWA